MFHFGFSYTGFIYLLMLFIPNIIWTKRKPIDYDRYLPNESKILQGFERIGEVLVCCIVLIFSDFNIRNTYWAVWLLLSFMLMILYEIYWVRYFRSQREMRDFYRSMIGIPVAGATLPVFAFFFLGIYGSNIFLIISVVILGIGHIGIHWNYYKEISGERKKNKIFLRIIKILAAVIVTIPLGATVFIIGCRNFKYISHFINTHKGVEEGVYVSLGGQEQYVLIRGKNNENPVIIYLHGGPSGPDSYITYGFSNYLVDDYTLIAWDQRGCGRTYFRNRNLDSVNDTATFEQALEDLDALVDYACDRFGQDKIIIMGHSYGTLLGSRYVLEHPDKVWKYIGVGQIVSLEKADLYSYEDALAKAETAGDDTSKMISAYEEFQKDNSLVNLLNLRNYTYSYHQPEVKSKDTWMAVTSPYFSIDDFRWFMKQLGSIEDYVKLNHQLFDYTLKANLYDYSLNYQVPVYFISGSCDWICPVESTEKYMNDITAPSKAMMLVIGCGHEPQYSLPKEFSEIVKNIIS